MQLISAVFLVITVILSNIDVSSATIESMELINASTFDGGLATRQLRASPKLGNEERAIVNPTLPGLLKRGGQIITDGVRVRLWLQKTGASNRVDDIFAALKLDDGLEMALTSLNLNTWFTYVKLYNKKYPKKKISAIGMFTKTYGDAALASTLELAKTNQKTKQAAAILSREQVNAWRESCKSIDDVFKMLYLDTAGDHLFTLLEFNTWINYIRRTSDKDLRTTAVSVLESHYGAAALARMLATAEPPIRSIRLLTTSLENTMLWRWLIQIKSPDDVFELLKLNNSLDKLLTNPVLETWMSYAKLFNQMNPDAQVPMLKTLANFFDAKDLAKVLVDGKKDPKISVLVKELETDLLLLSK